MLRYALVGITLCLSVNHSIAQEANDEGLKFFEQKIRPVLNQHCYSCHSKDAQTNKKLKAELYLDTAKGMLAGGETGPTLIKGQSAKSLIMKALKYDGLDMPPSGKLPENVIADFAKWIDMGAPDPRQGELAAKPKREINLAEGKQWWSFQPLKEIAPPAGKASNSIDRFIQQASAGKKLQLSRPATKEQLLRRAYYDLIGLPPTPEQIDAFAKDTSSGAFEKVVDELLASPRYGEKWARHWLDVARYAESGGYEFDGFRPAAYHYRDWVIRALNEDMPYNQFVKMQLAGDKLHPDDFQAASAAGFLVAGPYPGQITAKTVERIRYDQIDDMLMTVGGSMLGLTLGCVRCHEHKYDPLFHKDYYALAASLAKTVHGTRVLDPDPVATKTKLEKHQQDREPLATALRKFANDELPKRFDAWQKSELPKQPEATRWQILEPVTVDAERSYLKWLPGGIVAQDGTISPGAMKQRGRGAKKATPANDEYHITFNTYQKNLSSFRFDCFTDKALPQRGPGVNADGGFQLTELKITAKPLDAKSKEPVQELKLKAVFAAFEDKDQPLANAVDGKPATAWVVKTTAKKDNAAIFELDKPLVGFAGGTEIQITLQFRELGIGRLRVAMSTEPNPTTWAGDFVSQHVYELRGILAANNNKVPEPLRENLARWFAPFDEATNKVVQALRSHDIATPRPPLKEVYTTIDGGQDVFYLRRGEVDNKGEKATPGYLQVLTRGELPKAAEQKDPRIALADWMTDLEQGAGPLLARVMANRLWQNHFGNGIVRTSNDFGFQGERPTHPELLEWLAKELTKNGWKLKPLHKQIMLSATYQQSHESNAENSKIDPENRNLWHYQPRRLDAELIRDALLAVGGNLDTKNMYGPSATNDNSQQRSIYLRVKRSELIPLMSTFDAPEPTQSIGERISTTVPTQALVMLNSPLVRQQAEKLAKRIAPSPETPMKDAIQAAYRIAFARSPSDNEQEEMQKFMESQRKIMGGANPANNDKAFIEFCHTLLCLNEFVYID